MPKRTDINSILIIGAGPIVIGQACEFDYSGTQACKALKEEGYRVVLVNSNPATIMTDPDLADATYIEPITPEIVAKIIEKERPDALLPTMGGQTALNCALSLRKMGMLEKFGVEMIGATAEAIDKAEDRELFREAMTKIGLETPRSHHIKTLAQALEALEDIGLPAIIRPSFTLGGTGGGIAYNRDEFIDIVERGLDASPTNEVLIEESVLGWKEFEMEVVRDKNDNCIIICSIENVDPMGVHTGDSITVAPALTLTDKEYQIMRDASIAVLREIGVETGGSNVQFAVNPADGRLVVIEMNPRVSRSSALASKATGFPIAKVAAKLAVGYTLDEIANDITGGATPASFEPTIDYVVTKIPRFAFEKFPGADATSDHLDEVGRRGDGDRPHLPGIPAEGAALAGDRPHRPRRDRHRGLRRSRASTTTKERHPRRARHADAGPAAQGRAGHAAGRERRAIHNACRIDPWFLAEIARHRRDRGRDQGQGPADHRRRCSAGSRRWASPTPGSANSPATPADDGAGTSAARSACGRCSSASTPARPSSPRPPPTCTRPTRRRSPARVADEARPVRQEEVIILGGGPNRIGQGIEFDYCCCHACFALRDAGYETIMVNCNPETVSTDYDTSDRLYFEPLTPEDVLEIIDTERSNGTLHGVIVQFGGQTPLKLAERSGSRRTCRSSAPRPTRSTSPRTATASRSCSTSSSCASRRTASPPRSEQARAIADEIGYPVVIRPSYVLGGRAMEIVHDAAQLDRYVARLAGDLDRPSRARRCRRSSPLLIDRYLSDAIEVDVDCLADGKDTFIAGIMEHIEEAGIHSGDSACSLPPYSLDAKMIAELERQTRELALALNVGGLMNVQYAIKDGDIYVLEVNPRASRTVPFVAKVIGLPVAKIAARVMAGETLASFELKPQPLPAPRGEGSGVPVRPLPRRRHRARPGDEIDRRGHGPRPLVRDRLRQEPARRRHQPAARPAPCSSRCATTTRRASCRR